MDTERKWVTHLKDCIRKGAKDKRMISGRWARRRDGESVAKFCPMMTAWIGTGKVTEDAAYDAALGPNVSFRKINDDINEGIPRDFVEVFIKAWDGQPDRNETLDYPVERALEVVDDVAGHFDENGEWIEEEVDVPA